jgi:6-phosphogluconolactonase (cycloisomerase 2 family)
MTIERKVGMGIAGQPSGQDLDFWYTTEEYTGDFCDFTDVVIDSDGNVYGAGSYGTYANSQSQIVYWVAKYDYEGAVQWKKRLNPSNWNRKTSAVSIALDDDNGHLYITGEADNKFYLFKINSSDGSAVWQKELASNGDAHCLAVDSSGNIVTTSNNSNHTRIIKFAPNGTVTWAIKATISNSEPGAVCVDSSDNIYISSRGNVSGNKTIVIKVNSSGTVQWQKSYTATTGGGNYPSTGMVTYPVANGDDALYMVFQDSNGSAGQVLTKINSSNGAAVSGKNQATGEYSADGYNQLDVDKDGNVFWAVWQQTDNANGLANIHKFDADLNNVFTRKIDNNVTSKGMKPNAIKAFNNSYIVAAQFKLSVNAGIIIVLPEDGSLAGNAFGKINYLSHAARNPTSTTVTATTTSLSFSTFTFGTTDSNVTWQNAISTTVFQSIS